MLRRENIKFVKILVLHSLLNKGLLTLFLLILGTNDLQMTNVICG